MPGKDIKITSREGGAFDCYLSLPAADGKVPAIVFAAAVRGAEKAVRDLADKLASDGYIAAVPDLFWRTVPAPPSREDKRASGPSQPMLEKIKNGEHDLTDTLAEICKLAQFNGHAGMLGLRLKPSNRAATVAEVGSAGRGEISP
jgi:carboxymethylenebutenolidase